MSFASATPSWLQQRKSFRELPRKIWDLDRQDQAGGWFNKDAIFLPVLDLKKKRKHGLFSQDFESVLLLISRNPAPVDFVDIPVFLGVFNGFYTSQVVGLANLVITRMQPQAEPETSLPKFNSEFSPEK